MVTVIFENILLAFEFAGSGAPGENNAYLSLDTGQIYYVSEFYPTDEKMPEDLETSDRYLQLPHKNELELGKALALRFAVDELSHYHDRIAGFFQHKGAFAKFKDLLESEGVLERWYRYEAKATENALEEWCADNGIRLKGRDD